MKPDLAKLLLAVTQPLKSLLRLVVDGQVHIDLFLEARLSCHRAPRSHCETAGFRRLVVVGQGHSKVSFFSHVPVSKFQGEDGDAGGHGHGDSTNAIRIDIEGQGFRIGFDE